MKISPVIIICVAIILFWMFYFIPAKAAEAEPCPELKSFGCVPLVNCMPCEVVRDKDREIRQGGWCYIKKVKF